MAINIPKSFTEEELRSLIQATPVGLTPMVDTAFEQANKSHGDKKRRNGQPYLTEHVFPVTAMAIEFFGDKISEEIICSALLHDTLEDDENFTEIALETTFGPSIASIVKSLTKPVVQGELSQAQMRELINKPYFEGIKNGSYETKIIKLLDRIDNLHWVSTFNKEMMMFYLGESQSFYLPFAQTVNQDMYLQIKELTESLEARIKDYKSQ